MLKLLFAPVKLLAYILALLFDLVVITGKALEVLFMGITKSRR